MQAPVQARLYAFKYNFHIIISALNSQIQRPGNRFLRFNGLGQPTQRDLMPCGKKRKRKQMKKHKLRKRRKKMRHKSK